MSWRAPRMTSAAAALPHGALQRRQVPERPDVERSRLGWKEATSKMVMEEHLQRPRFSGVGAHLQGLPIESGSKGSRIT
eukprot:2882126-Pleurochrysis_carterae.AAC.1